MDGEPMHYAEPGFFDWGLTKPHGGLILLGSGLVYLAAFALCVLLIRRSAERVGYPRAGLVAGLVGLWPMVAGIVGSLDAQMTTMHYQERVHVPALITVGVTVGLVVFTWAVVEGISEGVPPDAARCRDPAASGPRAAGEPHHSATEVWRA
jgi:hypothetical protein